MPRSILTFYTIVTSDDGTPVESDLHVSIGGELQHKKERVMNNRGNSFIEQIYLFIPDKYLSDLTTGMKIIDADSSTYKLEYVEDFESHQEVNLKKL